MIELTPLTGWLAEVLIAVLAAVLLPVIKRLFDRLGVERDSELRETFDRAAHLAIELAVERAGTRLPDSVEAKNQIVRDASSWLVERFPDVVKHFDLTPDGIADSVRARLADHLDRD
jgi:hypothetical protein